MSENLIKQLPVKEIEELLHLIIQSIEKVIQDLEKTLEQIVKALIKKLPN
ncbi:hypothetical protein [Virgibacillus siamensis]|nr:hypothetical protein [Virgibacillus siamensis]